MSDGYRVDADELEAMLGAHRDRHGPLKLTAARVEVAVPPPVRAEDIGVAFDRAESRVTFTVPDPRPTYAVTLELAPDRDPG